MKNRIICITGATAGIGEACARTLAREGARLILTGRRADKLTGLAEELRTDYGSSVYTLHVDVRKRDEVIQALDALPEDWQAVDVLINNAGLAAGLDPVHSASLDDWEQMIDTNIKGLLFMTRALSPGMVQRKSGHIINIGSIAGKEVYQNGSVYCATKHAVDALTRGMRRDLLESGIKVSAIHPGAVETEFSLVRFKGDQERASQVYTGFDPLLADDIAEAVLFVLSRPDHVNIDDLLIMPAAQAAATQIRKEK